MTMELILTRMMPTEVVGTYLISGKPNQMPARALFLAPEAATSWREGHLGGMLVISDMLRTAEASLAAVEAGRGAQRPGYSGHNYGLCVDVDVAKTMRNVKAKTKADLDTWMRERGWYCHRLDGQITDLKGESHHYNFLGGSGVVISSKVESTSGYLEAAIIRKYGQHFTMTNQDAQAALARVRLYHGDIDGKMGPISKAAISVFKRAWELPNPEDTKLDKMFMRTLAFVAAERVIQPDVKLVT